MFRKSLAVCITSAFAVSLALAANVPASRANLSAAEIVEKNVAARGGLSAWRAVQTISMSGKIEVGPNERPRVVLGGRKGSHEVSAPAPVEKVQLPVLIEMKRSRKLRIELQFKGQTAVQTYDGKNGWKLRPFLNRNQVEPYTAQEMETASMQADLDGPLVDYKAKGTQVELEGAEKVGDRNTFKLKLTTKDGKVQHIWVDATNYLEVKIEGSPRTLDGKLHSVEVYYDNFHTVPGGIVVPYQFETKVEGVKQTEKIQIESVLVNPKLDDTLFGKPQPQ